MPARMARTERVKVPVVGGVRRIHPSAIPRLRCRPLRCVSIDRLLRQPSGVWRLASHVGAVCASSSHPVSWRLASGVSRPFRRRTSVYRPSMPVMVVGADHPLGEVIARKLAAPDREVRAFISSVDSHGPLRSLGIKVAIGDLSDESHVEAAATSCFTVVFVEPALGDGRDLAFAAPEAAAQGWAKAAAGAGVKRVIWVGSGAPPVKGPEMAAVCSRRSLAGRDCRRGRLPR